MKKETTLLIDGYTTSQEDVLLSLQSNYTESLEDEGVSSEEFFAILDKVILSQKFEIDQEKLKTQVVHRRDGYIGMRVRSNNPVNISGLRCEIHRECHSWLMTKSPQLCQCAHRP